MYFKLIDLDEGKYVLCCIMDSFNKKDTMGTISVYSDTNVSILKS